MHSLYYRFMRFIDDQEVSYQFEPLQLRSNWEPSIECIMVNAQNSCFNFLIIIFLNKKANA